MVARTLVFGGSGGIGFALAQRLVAAGRAVHLAARDETRLAQAAAALGGVAYSRCDVFDEAQIRTCVAAATEAGALGGLAYCVGSILLKPLKRAEAGDFLDVFRRDVLGAALAVKVAESALRAGNGAIVLFSSVAARSGFANHAVISAAKGGVEGLMLALAAELAPAVRVNCVAPSLLRTPLAAALTANEAMARSIAALHPLGRLGEADDAAAAAAFLLSAEAGWITGQVLGVDGGRAQVRSKG